MEWPAHTFASALFPSLESSTEAYIPKFPINEPAWQFFVEENEDNLKHQIRMLESTKLELMDRSTLSDTITFDESKGSVMVEEGAIIEPSTHFIGPCFVGKGAIIRHGAYIREHAWICSSALVGHCTEVKHSVLLPNSKAPHFNYVGDSILGKSVNLGAGVKLSNVRNDGAQVYLRIGESVSESGLRKLGAIIGEGCQLGCNAVTNPGTVLGINSIVWPNATVTGVHGQSSNHR